MSSLRIDSPRVCWLEAFIAASEEKSISGAARYLDINQSTVTRHIQSLEGWLGKKLIVLLKTPHAIKMGNTVQLTQDGQTFLEQARQVVGIMEAARDPMASRQARLQQLVAMVNKLKPDLNTLKPAELPDIDREALNKAIRTFQVYVERDMASLHADEIERFDAACALVTSAAKRVFSRHEAERKKEKNAPKESLWDSLNLGMSFFSRKGPKDEGAP